MSTLNASSNDQPLTVLAGLLTFVLIAPGMALADSKNLLTPEIAASGVPAPRTDEPASEPSEPRIEPNQEAGACPIRDEDLGQPASQVDPRFLPQIILFETGRVDQWGSGMCEEGLCCGDEHCKPPHVAPECTSTCDLDTFLCRPV
ncbi:MAG: hypothetical protein AAF657_10350 [Acidobacteriota bacterium]